MTKELASSPLGKLTPASKIVPEAITAAMLRERPEVATLFARFRVVKTLIEDGASRQISNEPMLAAANLLVEPKVHSICKNGPPSGLLY